MGASTSKVPGPDKALVLCRERKRFVHQAIEGRSAMASAHVAYIESLQNVGTSLRKFAEPGGANASPAEIPMPPIQQQFTYTERKPLRPSSTSTSAHIDVSEIPVSPRVSSAVIADQGDVNHVRSNESATTAFEEKTMVPFNGKVLETSNGDTQGLEHEMEEMNFRSPRSADFSPHSTVESEGWDYFEPETDKHLNYQADGELDHVLDYPNHATRSEEINKHLNSQADGELEYVLDDPDQATRVREEEGIPELEDDEERELASLEDQTTESGSENVSEEAYEDEQHGDPEVEGNEGANSHADIRMSKEDMDESISPDTLTSTALVLRRRASMRRQHNDEVEFTIGDFFSSIKVIEVQFITASDSGLEVAKKLEAHKRNSRPKFTETKAGRSPIVSFLSSCLNSFCDGSTEAPPARIDQRQASMKLTKLKSTVSNISSLSREPSMSILRDDVDDSDSDIGDRFCMDSGSHALTLSRLYAWERKLCDEVKASGFIRREYDLQCKLLREQAARDESLDKIDKTRASVKDLHSRILVAIHRIDSISGKIEELRDKELQPQLEELIDGLCTTWRTMAECHNKQLMIISTIADPTIQTLHQIYSESNRQTTMDLENHLHSLNQQFMKWINAQRMYVHALNKWLMKCVFPKSQKSIRRRRSQHAEFDPIRDGAPPIFVTCSEWSTLQNNLPVREVFDSIKGLGYEVHNFLPPPEDKKQHKLKVPFISSSKNQGGNENESRNNGGVGGPPVETGIDVHLKYENLRSKMITFFEEIAQFGIKSAEMYTEVLDRTYEARILYNKE